MARKKSLKRLRDEYYNTMIDILEEKKMCHLTCLPNFGKSWIAKRYIKEHPDLKILYVTYTADKVLEMNQYIQNEIESEGYAQTFYWCSRQKVSEIKRFISTFDTVIFDESHALGANNGKHMIDECRKNEIPYIGLTASPVRLDTINVVETFWDHGTELEYGIRKAITDGHLEKPEIHMTVYLGIRYDNVMKSLNKSKVGRYFENLLSNQERSIAVKSNMNNVIVKAVEERGIGIYIVYHPTIECLNIAQPIIDKCFQDNFLDVQSYSVTSDKDHMDVTQFIEHHTSDNSTGFSVVHSVRMLGQSWHFNDVRCLIFNCITSSPVNWMQQLGRCFKLGGERGYIIDLVGRFSGHMRYRFPIISADTNEDNDSDSSEYDKDELMQVEIEATQELKSFEQLLCEVEEWLKGGEFNCSIEEAIETWKMGNLYSHVSCGLSKETFDAILKDLGLI